MHTTITTPDSQNLLPFFFNMSKDKLTIASTEPVSLDDTPTDAGQTEPAALNTESGDSEQPTDVAPEVPAKDTKSEEAAPKTADSTVQDNEDAPPPPARPLSPAAQIKKDLKDAFPLVEDKYIEAVLIASEGRPDPAFTALLFLLDPTFKPEPVIAARTPQQPKQTSVADDELLARQLQKEYEREDRRRRSAPRRPRRDAPLPVDDDSPDEFDQIKETFTQGFEEARTTINGWVSGLSRKFSQENTAPPPPNRVERTQSPKLFGALGGSSFNNNTKKGRNFDEDPEILALDFRKSVDLDDDVPPQLPKREAARVEPQEPKKTDDKWQPLNSDVPVKSDAFLVTDLEDEDKK